MKRSIFSLSLILLLVIPVIVSAESLYSPTWNFKLDLPEGYEYIDGDGKDRFSFSGPSGAMFDLVVYNSVYGSIRDLANDVNGRLGNKGSIDFFTYRNKQAAIIELDFGDSYGWGLCVELSGAAGRQPPMLLALAYGPANISSLSLFHLSALDSIVPSDAERYYPGPIMEYSYPRGEQKQVNLAADGTAITAGGITATIRENDAEAAQILIEREFNILVNYIDTPNWREAWIRYYRFIYRDSYDRVADAADALVRSWGGNPAGNGVAGSEAAKREFAQKALSFVQGFNYERDFSGSDFLNLVDAVTEGRGDCDSRAMLWAIILSKAEIRSAMMVSRQYNHAMGLADIAGTGARFEAYETRWLVAETTGKVDIGLIAQDVSDPAHWLGIVFE